MSNYRTQEQFEELVRNTINGNWTTAAQNCVDGGFYANDLIKANEEGKEDESGYTFVNDTDIAILTEMAADIRNK